MALVISSTLLGRGRPTGSRSPTKQVYCLNVNLELFNHLNLASTAHIEVIYSTNIFKCRYLHIMCRGTRTCQSLVSTKIK